MKNNKYEIDMVNGSIMDKLISFALPLMISGILQLAFNAVDIIVVGQFSGSKSLAAVGSTTALINVFVNLFMGISLGANVLAARFYAAGKEKEMSKTVHSAIMIALISGIVMGVVGVIFARGALEIMGTPDDVIGLSTIYMRIYFCGMPFFMLYNYGAAILRAVGDTKRPLIFLIISGCINALLNLFFVIVCKLDVAGVAIGTIVSQFVSSVLVLYCLSKADTSYKLCFNKLAIDKEYMLQIFQVGIPAGIQSTVINISNAMLQSSVNSFGSIAMAGYTAANNILGFLYVSVNSITQACMSFTSQNYAVGKQKRMDRVLIDCLFLTTAVALVMGSASYIFGTQILGIYTSNSEVIKSGLEIISITTIPYFLCGIMDLFPGALRGMGYSTVPMILSIIGTVGVRIIWIYGLFPSHRSLFFLFISYSVADHRKVGLGHGNLGKMLLEEETECFCFLAGHESFAAAEGAIGIAEKANKVRQKPLRVILNGLGKDAAKIISRINGFTYVETQFDYFTGEVKEVSRTAYSDGPRAKVNCYGADDVREGVAIMHKEGVDVSITGNSTNPTRFQHPVAGTYKKECIEQGKKYFSVASGGGTGRTLHPDNMAAGPASYGMTDTMGRMHSDAQFAGSSSVPAHVEMMGLIGMGNNPMVGATVAVAVSIEEAAKNGKF